MGRFFHRESRKDKESLKKVLPSLCHSTLVASSCVESQGPMGRLTERSEDLRPEGPRASVASGGGKLFLAFLGSQHMMRRPEYCGIGRGGLFFKDSLSFLDSL